MNEAKVHALNLKLVKLVKLANRLEKLPQSWGTDEQLTGSEISLVEAIGDEGERLSVTDLARALRITKGAVSQTLKRLERKGLASKIDDPGNASRSIVKLTQKGRTAYAAHRRWHETMDGGFREYLASLSATQVDFMLEFMSRTERFFEQALK